MARRVDVGTTWQHREKGDDVKVVATVNGINQHIRGEIQVEYLAPGMNHYRGRWERDNFLRAFVKVNR